MRVEISTVEFLRPRCGPAPPSKEAPFCPTWSSSSQPAREASRRAGGGKKCRSAPTNCAAPITHSVCTCDPAAHAHVCPVYMVGEAAGLGWVSPRLTSWLKSSLVWPGVLAKDQRWTCSLRIGLQRRSGEQPRDRKKLRWRDRNPSSD